MDTSNFYVFFFLITKKFRVVKLSLEVVVFSMENL